MKSFLFLATTFFAFQLSAAKLEIDGAHSSVSFSVTHMAITKVNGSISGIKGEFDLPEGDFSKAKISATLDPSTINTNVAKRDEHLKNPDFLDVKKFSTITFKSKSIQKAGEAYTIKGELTLHGITKEVELTGAVLTPAIKDPSGKEHRGFTATTKINRPDFGVTWSKSLPTGELMVGNTVDAQINLELTSVAPSPKS